MIRGILSAGLWAAGLGRKRRAAIGVLAACYAVLWIGGVGRYLFVGPVGRDEAWAASAFLAVAGLLVLVSSDEWRALLAVAAAGFAAEIVGVRTGIPFGRYSYTDVLQPAVFGVPVVMTFAWMVLVSYVRQALPSRGRPTIVAAAIAAGWMTAIDLVVDPVAANGLDYWRWRSPGAYYGIPASNFVGWFAVSFAIFALLRRRPSSNPIAWLVGTSVVAFFSLVALSFSLWAAAALGAALCIAPLALRSRRLRLDAHIS